jgi:hypothetical protein
MSGLVERNLLQEAADLAAAVLFREELTLAVLLRLLCETACRASQYVR